MPVSTERHDSFTLITLPPWRWIPNSELPVVVFPRAAANGEHGAAEELRKAFRRNEWTNNWTAGIYPYPHYHSITHEALGILRGSCTIQLGGPEGYSLEARAGDVIVLPAGVAHACYTDAAYAVLGGYPNGRNWDLNTEDSTHPAPELLPVPDRDPVGTGGVLQRVWSATHR